MAISKLSAALSVLAVIDSAEAKVRPHVLFGDNQNQEWDTEPVITKTHEKKVRAPKV
jgi:hypothetical protein